MYDAKDTRKDPWQDVVDGCHLLGDRGGDYETALAVFRQIADGFPDARPASDDDFHGYAARRLALTAAEFLEAATRELAQRAAADSPF